MESKGCGKTIEDFPSEYGVVSAKHRKHTIQLVGLWAWVDLNVQGGRVYGLLM